MRETLRGRSREHPAEREEREDAQNRADKRGGRCPPPRGRPSASVVDVAAEKDLGQHQQEDRDRERTPDLDAEAAADDGGEGVVLETGERKLDVRSDGVGLVGRERRHVALVGAPAEIRAHGHALLGRERTDEVVYERHEHGTRGEGRPAEVERHRDHAHAASAEGTFQNADLAVVHARGNAHGVRRDRALVEEHAPRDGRVEDGRRPNIAGDGDEIRPGGRKHLF